MLPLENWPDPPEHWQVNISMIKKIKNIFKKMFFLPVSEFSPYFDLSSSMIYLFTKALFEIYSALSKYFYPFISSFTISFKKCPYTFKH